jgi:hypothetical protein
VPIDAGVFDVKARAGEPPTPCALTRSQGDSPLAAPDLRTVKGKRDSAILHVLMRAGLRRAELTRLTVGDYRLRPGVGPDPRSDKAKRTARRRDEPRAPRGARATRLRLTATGGLRSWAEQEGRQEPADARSTAQRNTRGRIGSRGLTHIESRPIQPHGTLGLALDPRPQIWLYVMTRRGHLFDSGRRL